jgi:hypothetical protein
MAQYKFIVDYLKANEFMFEVEWFETETEAWFVYNRLNEKGAVKGHLIDGLTGEVIAEFGYDEEECG